MRLLVSEYFVLRHKKDNILVNAYVSGVFLVMASLYIGVARSKNLNLLPLRFISAQ